MGLCAGRFKAYTSRWFTTAVSDLITIQVVKHMTLFSVTFIISSRSSGMMAAASIDGKSNVAPHANLCDISPTEKTHLAK